MVSYPMLKKAKEQLGIDLTPKGYIPESEDEIDFLFECEERPKTEIFEEVIIDYIKNNDNKSASWPANLKTASAKAWN